MRRGEIWSVATRGAYTRQPRPAMIVQDDRFDATASVTVCVLTTGPTEAPLFRLLVQPDAVNGLDRPSSLMVDKLTTVPRTSLGEKIGRLEDEDLVRVDLGDRCLPRSGVSRAKLRDGWDLSQFASTYRQRPTT